MRYRVIALDLDGTLLTSEKTILPESIDALSQARQAGAEVVIVTGRHHSAIHPFYQALQLTAPAICCNGTYLYDYQQKRVLDNDPMSVAQAELVIQRLEEEGIKGLLYADDAMLYQHPTPHVIRTSAWGESLPAAQRPLFTRVDDLTSAARRSDKLWKFALSHDNLPQLRDFALRIADEVQVTCEWSWADQVDISRQGNSKGKRLAEWLATRNLSMQDVIAFGDNYNDLSMLEHAGLGVAMGNADQQIKDRAGWVTGDNNRPSIAETIYQKVL